MIWKKNAGDESVSIGLLPEPELEPEPEPKTEFFFRLRLQQKCTAPGGSCSGSATLSVSSGVYYED